MDAQAVARIANNLADFFGALEENLFEMRQLMTRSDNALVKLETDFWKAHAEVVILFEMTEGSPARLPHETNVRQSLVIFWLRTYNEHDKIWKSPVKRSGLWLTVVFYHFSIL